MSAQEIFVEQFSRLFVHYQEALSSVSGPEATADIQRWENAPATERERLIAAGRLALMELESHDRENSRRWYARPGQAEWGC